MRLSLWPESLFGRLIAMLLVGMLLAQGVAIILIAREREREVLQVSVRDWSLRIAYVTSQLRQLDAAERSKAVEALLAPPRRFEWTTASRGEATTMRLFGPPFEVRDEDGQGLIPPPRTSPRAPRRRATSPLMFVPVPLVADFESILKQQLKATLGDEYQVEVGPTAPERRAIAVSPLNTDPARSSSRIYDVSVRFPDGYTAVFRLARQPWGAPLSLTLVINLGVLLLVMVIAMYVTARSISRPLSELASAADQVGRNIRQPKLEEKGARELKNAARAFNTMQDRLRRYLDTRTPVLAAMSHDLRTPLTRLRLQVEMLEDPALQARFSKELDEMQSMVEGALKQFRGLDDDEACKLINVNELLATLQSEQAEMGRQVPIEGRAAHLVPCKPHALKRCLTNLLENAIKFGERATLRVEEDGALIIRVRDEGPGIPPMELERVFEPFYRTEGSRNRETGGTGLGLSIARDIAQAHGGSLVLRNLPQRGLEALLVLPLGR
jgi:signal transduction histidine kinase